jgi:hypothetical protein
VYRILSKYRRLKMLDKKKFKKRYGSLIEDLNLKTTIGVYWNLLVLIRWSLTNAILIVFRDYSSVQI